MAGEDLEIRLLGPVEVVLDGRSMALGGPRPSALVALLALRVGETIPAERLIEDLWAGDPPEGAASTLKSYVSRLRPTFGGAAAIRGTRAGYQLDVEPAVIDVQRFEREVAAGRAAIADRRWRQAGRAFNAGLALWRGSPFGRSGDLPALARDAARLDDLRLEAEELRIEARLATSTPASVIDELDVLVAEHPYRERLWRVLMLALYHAQRQADALAAYRRARVALHEELGTEPGPELQQLEAAILRHEVPPIGAGASALSLPTPLTSFIGRADELHEIERRLETARLVTITGVGGVGKTRLGIEAARRSADRFADGVTFVDLAPLADAELVIPRIAATFDLREQPGTGLGERLAAYLRDREVLLVLDNCEHLREAIAELVAGLLAASPGTRVLATSRQVLDVPGESVYPTPSLALPGVAAPHDLRASDAVQLFLARARDARPSLRDDDASIEVIGRICASLDGLPLAIELAAAHARALTPGDIASRLGKRFQFLAPWRRFGPARHRTLRAAIDWSYDLLEAETRALLDQLSVFAGTFALESVAAVATDGDEAHALRLLERLVDASLVVVDSTAEPVRYRLLETIREYAAERLAGGDDEDAVRTRHADHFADIAAAAEEPLRSSDDGPGWVRRLAADAENLRAALRWSRDAGEFERILRIVDGVWWFWWIRGETREARTWMEVGLEHAAASDPERRARVLLAAAGLAWAQGDAVAAERDGAAAREQFAALGNRAREASALNTLGLTAHLRGDLEAARVRFEASLAAYRADGEPEGQRALSMATTIDNLGSVIYELGDAELAARRYREAQAINLRFGSEAVMNELHLARVAAERSGDLDEARSLLTDALRWYGERGWLQYVAECLEIASTIANAVADARAAARFLGASGAMRHQAGAPPVAMILQIRERELAAARETGGAAEAAAAFAEGETLTIDDAVAQTLAFLEG